MGRQQLANRATTLFWVGQDGQVHTRWAAPWSYAERSRRREPYRNEPTFVRTAQLETSSNLDYEFDYSIEEARGEQKKRVVAASPDWALAHQRIKKSRYDGERRQFLRVGGPFNFPVPGWRETKHGCFGCFRKIRAFMQVVREAGDPDPAATL